MSFFQCISNLLSSQDLSGHDWKCSAWVNIRSIKGQCGPSFNSDVRIQFRSRSDFKGLLSFTLPSLFALQRPTIRDGSSVMRWNAVSSECVQLWSGNNLTGNAEEERFPLDTTNNFTCREINSIVHKSHTNRTNRFVVHRLFSFFNSTLSSHHSFNIGTLQLQVDHNSCQFSQVPNRPRRDHFLLVPLHSLCLKWSFSFHTFSSTFDWSWTLVYCD